MRCVLWGTEAAGGVNDIVSGGSPIIRSNSQTNYKRTKNKQLFMTNYILTIYMKNDNFKVFAEH